MAEERKIPNPPANPESEKYLAAAKDGQLLVGHCKACNKAHFYPRTICPLCGSDKTEWKQAAGTGTIYSLSTFRRAPQPYTVAYVTLDEGPAMLTNIVDANPDSLKIGQKVKLTFKPSEDGQPVPMFTPA